MADQKIQKVWTFIIRGGIPFAMSLPQNPPLSHDGRRTIWKLVGTPRLAEMAKEIIEGRGASVDVHTEEQTEEQTRIRKEGPPDILDR